MYPILLSVEPFANIFSQSVNDLIFISLYMKIGLSIIYLIGYSSDLVPDNHMYFFLRLSSHIIMLSSVFLSAVTFKLI